MKGRLRPKAPRVSKTLRALIYQRDHGICRHCGQPVNRYAYDIDHVKRSVGGGSTLPANLVLAHQRCNRRRGNRTLAEWRAVLKAADSNHPVNGRYVK